MPSLSSLIVQRHVATVQEVEQAIARQVIHGGDLVTNLLEVAPACEVLLTPVLAESVGLSPAPPGRLPAPDADVLDVIPAELALGHGFFPLRKEGDTLVVATPAPLAAVVEQNLEAAISLKIAQLAAPLIRVREAIAAQYGIPLDARQLRLVAKLDAVQAGMPYRGTSDAPRPGEATPPMVLPKAPSLAPSTFASGLPGRLEPAYDVDRDSMLAPPPSAEPETDPSPSGEPPPAVVPAVQMVPPADPGLPTGRWHSELEAATHDAMGGPHAPHEPAGEYLDEGDVRLASEGPPVVGAGPSERATTIDELAPDRAHDSAEPEEDAHGRLTVPTPIEAIAAAPSPAAAHVAIAPAPDVEPEPSTRERPSHAPLAEPPPEEMTRRAPEVAPPPLREIAAAERTDDSPPPPSMLDRRALHGLLRREVASQRTRERSARRKGPFSRADAEQELDEAESADEVIDLFFAFVSQYFEYSAMFRVHGDIAEGRDAWGPGASRARVLGIGIPLDMPGSFSRARSQATIVLSRMDEDAIDVEILRDLERERPKGAPRAAAIVPVALRNRVVALLLGDDRESDVTVTQIGDLFGFAGLAAASLERIALTKKLGKAPPRVRAVGAQATRTMRAVKESGPPVSARPAGASSPPASGLGVSPGAESVRPPPSHSDVRPLHPDEARGASSAMPASVERAKPSSPPPRTEEALERAALGVAATELGPQVREATRHYDDEAFRTRPAVGQVAADPTALRVETLVGPGSPPDSLTDPRPPVARPHNVPIPREEDEDASNWLVEQGGSPDPPHVRSRETARQTEYLIIPERGQGARTEGDTQRGRDAALFGPYGALLMKATLGGLQAEEALAELAREADHSLPKIVAAFPGPLLVDRFRMRDQLPPASQCGPLLKLLVMLRRASLGFMTVRSASSEAEQRFWATHVLGELLFPEASTAILPRLFDDDVMVRRVARRAAIDLVAAGAPGEPLKQSLANMISSDDEPVHRRVLAIETLGEIRAAALLPALVRALGDRNEQIADAARRALLLITRQDLGPSPDVWSRWWDANREKHRIEWLIDALTHETPSLRRAAGEELKQLTNEYFGYYDDLPPRERERAQQKYREWWSEEGQFRFT